ncbi:helix-turn-helix transcriptional regulator [Streptomyces sp. NBC_00237]|uniref:winged helix-turn-helix transcriptional regulator n=1 Tax=Streptomyces sp. NBC_00237 TaxID=2975687 RepID=UPI00224CC68D|nr:helix-turn-helix domain-containing protein [Streptomyces sp. NBC_00237]MCX5204477.1 helix-turn-helix transcriptional regulator [Streptomyces sp. NBC_00237]
MKNVPYQCGLDAAVDVIDGKWKVLILWALHERPRRFGATRRELPGISEKVLASQLRELEADLIVHREVYEGTAVPRVEYSLTDLGRELHEALAPLGAWGDKRLRMLAELDDATSSLAG